MPNVFAVPVFFIVFRETTETSIIVSVLLAFLKQQIGPDNDKALYRKLQKQVSVVFSRRIFLLIVDRSGMGP
jgi:high-affinity iron transporter